MSTDLESENTSEAHGASSPPFIGALLRLSWQRVRGHMHEAIRAAGFADLQDAHFAVFSYPLPNGVRPSDLARQIRMSRQATNYLIAQLEELGYLERRAPEGSERRLVHLTGRGWQVADTIHACLQQLQAQWADEVGSERFSVFMDVLRHLSKEDGRPPAAGRAG